MQGYWNLIKKYPYLLTFGVLLTCLSGLGQTFFVGIFNSYIISDLNLTNELFSRLYSGATLMSAISITWLGQLYDKVSLKLYSSLVLLGLAGACLCLGLSHHIIALFVGLFLLRLFGQGLMTHTAITTMSKYFVENRGKALGIATLGYPISEVLLPTMMSLMLAKQVPWQSIWLYSFGALIIIVLPSIIFLLQKTRKNIQTILIADNSKNNSSKIVQFTKQQVIRDWRFYCVLPIVLAPALINTAIFFQQSYISTLKSWPLELFGMAFGIYAVCTVITGAYGGFLIDKYSARQLLKFFAIPLALGIGALIFIPSISALYLYMVLAGLTSGLASLISGALWAEVYGVNSLGAIRSLVLSYIIFSTAITPWLTGWLIDSGVNFYYVLSAFIIYIFIGILLSLLPKWNINSQTPTVV